MRQNINAIIGGLLKKRQDKSKKDHERELHSLPHHLCLKPIEQFPEFRQKKYRSYTGEKMCLVKEDEHQTLGHLVMAAAGVATLSKVNSFAESREDSFDAQSTQTEGTLEHQRYPLNSNDSDQNPSRYHGMGSSFNDSLSLDQTGSDQKGDGKNDNDKENESNDNDKKDEKSYAVIYLGLVILSLGCVFSFVGLGDKGFKTFYIWSIGPVCIVIGLFMVCYKVMQCHPTLWDLKAYYAKNKRIRPQVREPAIFNMAEQGMAGKMPNGGPPNSNLNLILSQNQNQNQNQSQDQSSPFPNSYQSQNLPNSSKTISTIEITSPPLKKVVLHSPTLLQKTPRPMLHKSPQFQRGTYDIIDDEVLTRSYISEIPFGTSSQYHSQSQSNPHYPTQPQLYQYQQSPGGPQITRPYRIPQIID